MNNYKKLLYEVNKKTRRIVIKFTFNTKLINKLWWECDKQAGNLFYLVNALDLISLAVKKFTISNLVRLSLMSIKVRMNKQI